ncbi:MAG: sulfite exporter TauE/SafE family protein [Candidatus Peribacteria bacterium]|jgi:sulfite exporter TauE/SafE/copper chaperone CopZ|nr:sulfite exporter TauE/SafE family protein [Candidatus Peribacteria bacterium]
MKTTVFYLKGMHCNACKLLVEKTLIKLPHIQTVDASVRKGSVKVRYEGNLHLDEIGKIIREVGYEIVEKPLARPRFSRSLGNYKIALISLIAFIFLYFVLKATGVSSFFDIQSENKPSLGIVLLIGLTAGFSSCMAVVGGLVLAISSQWNVKNNEENFGKKLIPHFRFNTGRIVGFGLLGGILGLFGGVLTPSPLVMAVMMLLVGIVMLLLGLNLTELSPKLQQIAIALPTGKWFSQGENELLGSKKQGIGKAVLSGILTFFVPCGFTFAMQLYAISTGSFWMGMAVMALFAVGTLPGLIGIGSLTSLFKGKVAKVAYKVIGILVLLLGVYNIANSYGVVRANLGGGSDFVSDKQVEKILMTYTAKDFLQPNRVELEVGKEYEIVIDAQTTLYGCMSTIFISGLDDKVQSVEKGKQIVFHVKPKKAGNYEFLCAMGLPHNGKIVVK